MLERTPGNAIAQHLTLSGSIVRLEGVKVGGRSVSDSDNRMLILVHIAPAVPRYQPHELNDFARQIMNQVNTPGHLDPSGLYPVHPETPRWLMAATLHYNGLLPTPTADTHSETALALPWATTTSVETRIRIYPHIKFAQSIARRQQGLVTGHAYRSDLNNGWISLTDIERVRKGLDPQDVEIRDGDAPRKSGFWFRRK